MLSTTYLKVLCTLLLLRLMSPEIPIGRPNVEICSSAELRPSNSALADPYPCSHSSVAMTAAVMATRAVKKDDHSAVFCI